MGFAEDTLLGILSGDLAPAFFDLLDDIGLIPELPSAPTSQ